MPKPGYSGASFFFFFFFFFMKWLSWAYLDGHASYEQVTLLTGVVLPKQISNSPEKSLAMVPWFSAQSDPYSLSW